MYGTGKERVPCIPEKDSLDELLRILESSLKSQDGTGGVILVTVLDDDSLVYLLAGMRRNGLMKKFLDLIIGFSNLQTLFKKKEISKKNFNLKFLDKFARSILPDLDPTHLEKARSNVVAKVGFATLKHILRAELENNQFSSNFAFPIMSGTKIFIIILFQHFSFRKHEFSFISNPVFKLSVNFHVMFSPKSVIKYLQLKYFLGEFNKLLGEGIKKPELKIFDEQYFELHLERSVSLDPDKVSHVSLLIVPGVRDNNNTLFDILPLSESRTELFQIKTSQQRSNTSGVLLVKVKNITKNKVRLPKGMLFGLVEQAEEEDSSSDEQTISTRSAFVDLEKLYIQPSSEDSETSTDSLNEFLSEDDTAEQVELRSEVSGENKSEALDVDLELMASTASEFLANDDLFKELSDELTPVPPIVDNWEELNPTFTSFNIDSNLDVEGMEGLEEDLSLVPDLPIFDQFSSPDKVLEPTVSPDFQKISIEPKSLHQISESPEITEVPKPLAVLQATPEEPEMEDMDISELAPLTLSTKVSREREPIPIDELKPLVAQLKVIREKIKKNTFQGDLSDQFPSLMGDTEYTPLFATMIQYTGCKLEDIDYDFLDFGERFYSEILNFGIESLEELFVETNKLHEMNKSAVLQDWVAAFSDRFDCLKGINDLNGENFDVKVVQWMVLHFCDRLDTLESGEEINPRLRDMIGYSSFDGVDIIEMELSTGPARTNKILELGTKEENIIKPSSTEDTDQTMDIIEVVPGVAEEVIPMQSSVKEQLEFKLSSDNMDVSSSNLQKTTFLSNDPSSEEPEKDGKSVESEEIKILSEDVMTENSVAVKLDSFKEDEQKNTDSEPHPPKSVLSVIPEKTKPSLDKELITTNKETEIKNKKVSLPDNPEKIPSLKTDSPTTSEIKKKSSEKSNETSPSKVKIKSKTTTQIPQKPLIVSSQSTNITPIPLLEKKTNPMSSKSKINSLSKMDKISPTEKERKLITKKSTPPRVEKSNDDKQSLKSIEKISKPSTSQQKRVTPSSQSQKITPPLDPDEDFCDLFLGVKMDASKTECSVMIFNDEFPTNAVFSARNLYINGLQVQEDADVENLLKGKGEDQDLILVHIPRLNKDGISTSDVSIPLSSWDDGKFFFSGFVMYHEPKVIYKMI